VRGWRKVRKIRDSNILDEGIQVGGDSMRCVGTAEARWTQRSEEDGRAAQQRSERWQIWMAAKTRKKDAKIEAEKGWSGRRGRCAEDFFALRATEDAAMRNPQRFFRLRR
jgi:hypothetical protein